MGVRVRDVVHLHRGVVRRAEGDRRRGRARGPWLRLSSARGLAGLAWVHVMRGLAGLAGVRVRVRAGHGACAAGAHRATVVVGAGAGLGAWICVLRHVVERV